MKTSELTEQKVNYIMCNATNIQSFIQSDGDVDRDLAPTSVRPRSMKCSRLLLELTN